jgi:hypothetical protein
MKTNETETTDSDHPSPHPDLIKVTEIFLIPSSFLVAALGTADTNLHRSAVSAVALLISILWWTCSREAFVELIESVRGKRGKDSGNRTRILCWLPIVFVVGWFISLIVHAILWNQPLGSDVVH